MPGVNWALLGGCVVLVLAFGNSDALAAAYGIAVTGTMAVTTLAFYLVIRTRWKWSLAAALPLCGAFLIFDLSFFTSNLHKIAKGGWFPLAVAALVIAIMHTWKKGRMEIFKRVYAHEITEDELRDIAQSEHITRVRGTAVFMAGNPSGTPLVLLHHVKANKVLHLHVVLLTILTDDVPAVAETDRLHVREIGHGVWRVIGHYGYMESPDVTALMERARNEGVPIKVGEAVYFFNREMIITGGSAPMWRWQKALYAVMSRNARSVRDYYRIEPSQIIEIGLPVVL
jgi:KUP system potassium uptake protein